jgi:hypothetical protein
MLNIAADNAKIITSPCYNTAVGSIIVWPNGRK